MCTEIGKPINPRNLLRIFKILTEEADLPHIRFHDLRHTHAALMIFQNEPMKLTLTDLDIAKSRLQWIRTVIYCPTCSRMHLTAWIKRFLVLHHHINCCQTDATVKKLQKKTTSEEVIFCRETVFLTLSQGF
ncbi:MAG: hypothetical protein ABWX97_09485 [Domibacillus tundrae]